MTALYDHYHDAYVKILVQEDHSYGVLHPAAWISEEWEVDTEFLIQESDARERLQALADQDPDLCACVVAGMNMRMDAVHRPKLDNGRYDCSDLYVEIEEAYHILSTRDWNFIPRRENPEA